MALSSLALALVTSTLLAPDPDTAATEAPADPETTAAEPSSTAPDPYAAQAVTDVQTLLDDTGREYLAAWGRLEQHPALAAQALLDRLAEIPGLGPAKRKRLLDILAGLKRPEHVPLFAKELRRAVVQAQSLDAAKIAADRWRPLLTDQGAAAVPHLQPLVGDRELPLAIRALLVADLVDVSEDAGQLVVLVGRGHPDLARALRNALVQRARSDAGDAAALRAAADAAIETTLALTDPAKREGPRATALVWLRSHVASTPDTAFVDRLAAISGDDDEAFALRVAAARGLGRFETKHAQQALTKLARGQLTTSRRATQRGEILGWLALQQLPPEQARPIADALQLTQADAPRLAALGFGLGTLGAGHGWLTAAMHNPWPQVRQAALARVVAPCSNDVVDALAQLGGGSRKASDDDGAAARSATQALGRCGGDRARAHLVKQLRRDEAPMEQRAEAARQLTRHGGPQGVDAVARELEQDVGRALARRLASALRYAPAPTERATRALCRRLEDAGEVARAAAVSLRKLHRGAPGSPCSS